MNIKLAVSLIIIGVCIVVVGAGYYLHVNNLNIVLLSPLATSSPVQIIGQAQETPQPQPVAVITSLPDEEH
ncbi:hypothetical protein HY091_01470, partial [Candidatus Kaiserbacteria bacterium]|nr:hypothetical protein [Candidatus Kaiserbacteria bacterium]